MAYNIKEIEGIGPAYAEKLGQANITTTDDLLQACTTPAARKSLAEETGFETRTLLDWANKADLMRIKGVGEEYSDLLEASGVDTVKELATRNAENLVAKMTMVNEEKNLTNALPSKTTVAEWIHQAGDMDAMIEY